MPENAVINCNLGHSHRVAPTFFRNYEYYSISSNIYAKLLCVKSHYFFATASLSALPALKAGAMLAGI